MWFQEFRKKASGSLLALIVVTGEGEVRVPADVLYLNLNVQTKAKEATLARKKNSDECQRVQKILDSNLSIEKKDIQTLSYDFSPEYQYEPSGKTQMLGFRVDHTLRIRIKEIDRVGEVLDQLTAKGSGDRLLQIQGVEYATDRRGEYEVKALEAAMMHAQARAAALAKTAKKPLGEVDQITDSQVNWDPGAPTPMGRSAEASFMASATALPTQLNAGELTIKTKVRVTYK